MSTLSLPVRSKHFILRVSLCLLGLVLARTVWIEGLSFAQADSPVTIKSHQKISDTEGGFSGLLTDGDLFGVSVISLGDLDGDGVTDLAVGSQSDNDGGSDRGAVWILFMNSDGTVKGQQKISDTAGNFSGLLENGDEFGLATANLGDLDGDDVVDIAVGAYKDDDGGNNRGAIWILFMNSDGTVKGHQKISDTAGNFSGILDNDDQFGVSTTALGDLDGDSVTDLAVGAFADDDGAIGQSNRGAVWILFMNPDGSVKGHQKISDTDGNFDGVLSNDDLFGSALANLGDLDGDSVVDLAVGAFSTDDGGSNRGAVWILFMNSDGTVKGRQKIGLVQGGFTGDLEDNDRFGTSVITPGDLDGDSVIDLLVGAYFDDDGGADRGAVWLLFLNADGAVKGHQKISSTTENFTNLLDDGDFFGRSVAPVGDLDNDGVTEIAVSAYFDDDGGIDRGAVWILFLGKPEEPIEINLYLPLIIKDCTFTIFGCI